MKSTCQNFWRAAQFNAFALLNYNEQIRAIFGDKKTDIRYHAMGVNTGMERLVKMMKIGTLSSMLVNQNL